MREILGRKFAVDNQGWIALTDYMGSDHSIAECARTSYGGNKKGSDDEKLINYMMRHGHTSPFEQAELQFLVYVPMDTWRQWVRHRTASINEYSTRYSEAIDEIYEATEWRYQSQNNRQGSEGVVDQELAEHLSDNEKHFHKLAKQLYKSRVRHGIAREQARKDLPLATFTRAYWKIDLHNLLHFLKLRMAPEAQQEIRHYAEKIAEIVEMIFPLSWAAFKRYELDAMKFSAVEKNILFRTLTEPENFDNIIPDAWKIERCRERNEFIAKVNSLLPENKQVKYQGD